MRQDTGATRSFEDLCGEVWPSLASTLGYICRDAGVGQELAQEALARAWAHWDHVRQLPSPEAWLFRVGLNLAYSRFRRGRVERRALRRLAGSNVTPPPRTADEVAVRAAVAALPERQRAAVILRYFADLPFARVAEILGCAEGTARSLASQAIDRLGQSFDLESTREDAR